MLTLLLTAFLAQAVPPSQDFRISVFITAPTRDGFVDTGKDIQDSVKDVRNAMKGMKELRIVDDPKDADLLLTVVTRGVGSQAYGTRTSVNDVYRGTDITTAPIYANTFWVSTVLSAGSYRKEFVGFQTQSSASSLGAWSQVAGRVAKEVQAWAVANADQLRSRRKKPPVQ
jgi:hypothetical protein